ncbi:MAG: glycosyltransferase family 2 protein [bacterium]
MNSDVSVLSRLHNSDGTGAAGRHTISTRDYKQPKDSRQDKKVQDEHLLPFGHARLPFGHARTTRQAYPRISVITPSYNQAVFLETAILSVLNQHYPNLEYIVIDGGSMDGSVEIIKKYRHCLSYWISEPDKGMYHAINKGLRMARGEIIAYLNSDDLYLPDAFRAAVEHFQKEPQAALIYSNCLFIDANGDCLYTYRYLPFTLRRFAALTWSSIAQPTTFWRNSIHQAGIYFDESFKMAGDFDFYLRVGQQFRIDYIKGTIAAFRLHQNSQSARHRKLRLEELSRIRKKHSLLYHKRGLKLWRYVGELQMKMANFPLMLRKLL